MSDYLKPCAHCGETGIDIREDTDCEHCTYVPGKHFKVTCSWCYLSIIRDTKEEAIAAWNRRASPSWSTEPPTAPGWWIYAQKYPAYTIGNKLVYRWTVHIVQVSTNSPERFPEETLTFRGVSDNSFRSLDDFIHETRSDVIFWHKIDVPAPLEKGGKTE